MRNEIIDQLRIIAVNTPEIDTTEMTLAQDLTAINTTQKNSSYDIKLF